MDFFKFSGRDKTRTEIQQRKKQQQEYKLINSIRHNPGHTLFSINTVTGKIKEAAFEVEDTISWKNALLVAAGVGMPKKVVVKKDCVYIEALNKENALKKIQTIMERKIGETFEYKGKTYKAIEEVTECGCTGCAFENKGCINIGAELGVCGQDAREDKKGVIFVAVKPEEKHDAVEIPSDLYKRLVYLGIIDPTGTRDSNVGNSDYSKHLIQPWSIMLDHNLNYWDGDIIKRTLREKAEGGMTKTEARIMDYKKIIHNCEERIRQLELGK